MSLGTNHRLTQASAAHTPEMESNTSRICGNNSCCFHQVRNFMLGDFLSFLWWTDFLLASHAPPGKYNWIAISKKQVHSDPPGLATLASTWLSGCPAVVTRGDTIHVFFLGSLCQSIQISYYGLWGEFWPITTTTTTTMQIQLHLYIGNSQGNNKTIIFSFAIIMYVLLLSWLVLLQSYCNNMSKLYWLKYLPNYIFHICRCFCLESPKHDAVLTQRSWAGVLQRTNLVAEKQKLEPANVLAEFTKLFGT